MDSQKISLGENRFGKGLFASERINAGEFVMDFDGEIYEARRATELPPHCRDHAIQFEEHRWRDSNGLARNINHSCEPNCGVQGLFSIVAMRDIEKGEELLWDYDMSEDGDWRMDCHCGTSSCRKVIGSFALLPESIRQKYRGYISDWLVEKYGLSVSA